MAIRRWAAIVFGVLSAGVIVFQLALAAGAPWGEYAMGGVNPGRFPPALRVGAVVQAALFVGMAGVVLARAGVALPRWARAARRLIWLIVALLAVSLVLNLLTPSAGERLIWAPVALIMLVCSLIVATGKPAPQT